MGHTFFIESGTNPLGSSFSWVLHFFINLLLSLTESLLPFFKIFYLFQLRFFVFSKNYYQHKLSKLGRTCHLLFKIVCLFPRTLPAQATYFTATYYHYKYEPYPFALTRLSWKVKKVEVSCDFLKSTTPPLSRTWESRLPTAQRLADIFYIYIFYQLQKVI